MMKRSRNIGWLGLYGAVAGILLIHGGTRSSTAMDGPMGGERPAGQAEVSDITPSVTGLPWRDEPAPDARAASGEKANAPGGLTPPSRTRDLLYIPEKAEDGGRDLYLRHPEDSDRIHTQPAR